MKLRKTFLVLTTLFILLGSNLALAVSETPIASGEISGEISGELSGEISGELSGEINGEISGELSGEVSGELVPNESGDLTLPSGEEDTILASTANDSNFVINANETLSAALEATISGDETFNYIIVTMPSSGEIVHTDLSSPAFSYTPAEGFSGTDSFTFRLESGDYYSNIGTVTITVNAIDEDIIPFYYEDMQNHWANYSASHLAARGFIVGENIGGDFYYYPDKTMTRGDFLLFLLSIVSPSEAIEAANVTFADEESIPEWLLEKAKIAFEMEIISGVGSSDSIFLYPNKSITRAEAFTMINNALLASTNYTNSNEELTYNDKNNIPEWAVQAIKNLTGYQIIQGDTAKNIKANSIVTRGEAAELCFKLLKELEADKMSNSSSGDLK